MRKCAYCDFYSAPLNARLAARFARCVARELSLQSQLLSRELCSVFIGGGTPTCLPNEAIETLLEAIRPLIGAETEFSIEANPGTLNTATLHTLQRYGVNRISLGVQSFDDALLATLGRIHDAEQARQGVDAIRNAGIDNLNLDLIYAIPGQSLAGWRKDLREALALNPQHLSCYALGIEPGTPLHEKLQAGSISETDDETQRTMYETAISEIASRGLEQYEISNFAAPNRQCVHNLTYWKNQPYLGIGPAAASYVNGERRTNVPDLQSYLSALENDRQPPFESERLTDRHAMAEHLMLSLRLTAGLDRIRFAQRYGIDVHDAFSETIDRYASQGLLKITEHYLRLTPEAYFVANGIFSDFFQQADR